MSWLVKMVDRVKKTNVCDAVVGRLDVFQTRGVPLGAGSGIVRGPSNPVGEPGRSRVRFPRCRSRPVIVWARTRLSVIIVVQNWVDELKRTVAAK